MKKLTATALLKSSKSLSLLYAFLITGSMFVAIPLTQIASEKSPNYEFETVTVYKAPPPPPEVEEIKQEEEEKEEEELKLEKSFKKLSLSTIEMALTVGSGGDNGNGIYIGSFEINDSELGLGIVFDVSELDQPPVALVEVSPKYPIELKRNKLSGGATAEFIVTKDGDVKKIKIKDSTNPAFGQAIKEALKRWQFEPGMKNNEKVNTRVRLPFYFNFN